MKERNLYAKIAVVLLNTVIMLVIFNLLIALFLSIEKRVTRSRNPVEQRYKVDLRAVYPDMEPDAVNRLLDETVNRTYAYEPFTGFRERPFAGEFVNVSEHGFRKVAGQGPWPIDPACYNIFFFGGSTLFGYGVADAQTLPSQLQAYLTLKKNAPVRVYNFGRGFYYLSQEVVLLARLLSGGNRPDMVIFLDGLNDFYFPDDEPHLPAYMAKALQSYDRGKPGVYEEMFRQARFITQLPMYRLVEKMRSWVSKPPADAEKSASDRQTALKVIDRYFTNKLIATGICAEFGIEPVFVWQPVASYKIDLDHHLFPSPASLGHGRCAVGYPLIEGPAREESNGRNLIWAADIQEGRRESLYVDAVHYNAKMNRMLAEFIGERIVDKIPDAGTAGKKMRRGT